MTTETGTNRRALPLASGETRKALEEIARVLSETNNGRGPKLPITIQIAEIVAAAQASEDVQGWRTPLTRKQLSDLGYALVPVEPTDEMLVAAEEAAPVLMTFADREASPSFIAYRAMLAAAPPAPETRT